MNIDAARAAAAGPAPASAAGKIADKSTDDKDMFLKLLVAQIKYQDPTNPQNGLEFMQQTAQYTMIEKLAELSDQNTKILQTTQSMVSGSLVGKTVTATSDQTGDITGKVDRVKIDPTNGVIVVIGKNEFPLAKVKEIGA